VIQPPTPPVNPAPPGGARREARQRQAAAQKSGSESDQESQAQDGAGDLAEAPRTLQGAQMTRQDPARADRHNFTRGSGAQPAPSFTPLTRSEPAAGAQPLLYTGGITLLALALGYTHGRPTPRRRTPDVPAPAFARARIRNR
jgi:hypothetical protein